MKWPDEKSATLDWLRGLACWLMMASHFGVAIRTNAGGEGSFAEYLITQSGSFAPVLFFFCTGAGYGLKPSQGADLSGVIDLGKKSILLILADQLLRVYQAEVVGLDFLAFIGISSMVVGLIAAWRLSASVIVAGIGILLLARFGTKNWVHGDTSQLSEFAIWFTGVGAVDGASYPLAPWLVYPLLGLLFGRWMRAGGFESASGRVLRIPLLMLGIAASVAVVFSELPKSRWGFMSNGYFLLTVVVLPVLIVSSSWIAPRCVRYRFLRWLFMVRGTLSLSIVPVHYTVLALLEYLGGMPDARSQFILAFLLFVFVSLFLARAASKYVDALAARYAALHIAFAGGLILAAVGLSGSFMGWPPKAGAAFGMMLIGQLAVAALLAGRNHINRAPEPATSVAAKS